MKTTPATARSVGLLRHARLFLAALVLGAVLTLGLRAAFGPGDSGSDDPHAGHDRGAVGAHVEHETSAAPATDGGTGLLVDLGNPTCPVMGNPVSGHAFSEWNGLRIGHCCPGCDEQLAEDPEGFLDEAAPGWRDALAAIERFRAAEGAEREEALRDLRAEYDVVREPEPAGSDAGHDHSVDPSDDPSADHPASPDHGGGHDHD